MQIREINTDLVFLELDETIFLHATWPSMFAKPDDASLPKGFNTAKVQDVVLYHPDDGTESCDLFMFDFTAEEIKTAVNEHCTKGGEVGYYIKKADWPEWVDCPQIKE